MVAFRSAGCSFPRSKLKWRLLMLPESNKLCYKYWWNYLILFIHTSTIKPFFSTLPSNPHIDTESVGRLLFRGLLSDRTKKIKELFITEWSMVSEAFITCSLTAVLYSHVRYEKTLVFPFLFWEQKKLLQFSFGCVLIFLPNPGQHGLGMALTECFGNCSQLMNAIK